MVYCAKCGAGSTIRVSRSSMNPSRRYYCCNRKGANCGFIDWCDIGQRDVDVIPNLLRMMNEVQDEVREHKAEARRYKIALTLTWALIVIYFLV